MKQIEVRVEVSDIYTILICMVTFNTSIFSFSDDDTILSMCMSLFHMS